MEHIFLINPKAGTGRAYNKILPQINKILRNKNIQHRIHITTRKNDAIKYVQKICKNKKSQTKVRFYACGGDGTLNEVVNGAYGYENVEIACIPSGSGNDFIRNFDNSFTLEKIIDAKAVEIDVLECILDNKKVYTINIINMGIDCDALKHMEKAREKNILKGASLYIYGVCRAFLNMNTIKINIQSNELNFKGEATLLAIGNGTTYGGGFVATPLAKVDDNLMDICLVKKINHVRFLSLISEYKKGKHVNTKKTENIVLYEKTNQIKIESQEEIAISVDGELEKTKNIDIKVIGKGIKFVVPTN